jgi:hypothetical protein
MDKEEKTVNELLGTLTIEDPQHSSQTPCPAPNASDLYRSKRIVRTLWGVIVTRRKGVLREDYSGLVYTYKEHDDLTIQSTYKLFYIFDNLYRMTASPCTHPLSYQRGNDHQFIYIAPWLAFNLRTQIVGSLSI